MLVVVMLTFMAVRAVIFDWGGTLTPWDGVDRGALWQQACAPHFPADQAASVAAASIVAKVTRDRMMCELDERYPEYGFCRHKGYVTEEHQRALAVHGPSAVHRRSFRNVTDGLQGEGE